MSVPNLPKNWRANLEADANELGFESIGITTPDAIPEAAERLARALKDGHHATMGWMEETAERRGSPTALWPDVQSVIVLAMNYGPEFDPLTVLDEPERGAISVYARHRDYHDVMKGKVKTLASKLAARHRETFPDIEVKVFVDTAPVMEKPLAQAAGLGWQGKHTNLVSRDHGSWLFLASLFTNLSLPVDKLERDHCGSCMDCHDACPTNAFPAPYRLDARRCISYLTIEHHGPIPHEFRKPMGNRIYGCDDCLAVCPWNKFAHAASEVKLASPEPPRDDDLAGFLALDDTAFRTRFSGSPVKRIGRDRFIRNCCIAAGNSALPELLPAVEQLTQDADETVAEAARWAEAELRKN
ncbi:tRNA epoxyqueuosine(34) reductase QueG [Ahrensia sp. R2A130]|uniref:tRNA epoxyqueuosine(34) reductase QueG n=1 Tax=Ahrensia sp. R2A130 TaxID=744979 RepID=UPI0001E0A4C8|nr:tRNA epoxyqueuosine(34) reductase QueG [Ahrensia sp. R2A130]EFL88426.1 putative electron transport protein YjeS [Ahrensia sp. R2A130]